MFQKTDTLILDLPKTHGSPSALLPQLLAREKSDTESIMTKARKAADSRSNFFGRGDVAVFETALHV